MAEHGECSLRHTAVCCEAGCFWAVGPVMQGPLGGCTDASEGESETIHARKLSKCGQQAHGVPWITGEQRCGSHKAAITMWRHTCWTCMRQLRWHDVGTWNDESTWNWALEAIEWWTAQCWCQTRM
eukprot:jgi/Ulvmu1/9686/UM055_0024.1